MQSKKNPEWTCCEEAMIYVQDHECEILDCWRGGEHYRFRYDALTVERELKVWRQ